MCNTCNQLKINNNINGIIALMESKDISSTCYKGMDTYLGSIELHSDSRLTVARAVGAVEPELHQDDSPTLYKGCELELNRLVVLQERMSKGMVMIQECNDILNQAKSGRRLPYKTFMAWVNRRTYLWSCWNILKAECMAVAAGTPAWPEFFKLKSSEINQWSTWGKADDHDEAIDSRMMDTVDAYAVAHIADNS